MQRRISPRLILDEISKTVVGQEEAKKVIVSSMFLHFIRWYNASSLGKKEIKKSNLLIMGPSGTGKTFIVREAVKAFQLLTQLPIFPLLELDCTELTARGWEGEDLSTSLIEHYNHLNKDDSRFSSTIVFLDEFDKLCKPAFSSKGMDHNRNTQYNMLKTIEGTDVKTKAGGTISTHKIMFIFAGNFSEIRDMRKQNDRSIGFTDTTTKKYVDYHTELDEIGMATQLVGRTSHIAELYDLTAKELNTILEIQLLPELKEVFTSVNRDLKLTTKERNKLIKNCLEKKTGARGLYAETAKLIDKHLFDAEVIL